MLISPSYSTHKRAKLLRWYGLDRENTSNMRCEQNVSEWGFKFHMNDINATIGIGNLTHIEDTLQKHRENGLFFHNELKGIKGTTLLENSSEYESSHWIFTLRVKNRAEFIKHMKNAGIECSRVHERNDQHECLKEYRIPLPGTSEICDDMICIPCGWWVDKKDREHIVRTIKKGW